MNSTTRPPAIPAGYSLRPRATRPRWMPCKHKTPCGKPCELLGGTKHSYHSCADAACTLCHGNSRFERVQP